MRCRRVPSEVIKFIKRENIRLEFKKDHFDTKIGQKKRSETENLRFTERK